MSIMFQILAIKRKALDGAAVNVFSHEGTLVDGITDLSPGGQDEGKAPTQGTRAMEPTTSLDKMIPEEEEELDGDGDEDAEEAEDAEDQEEGTAPVSLAPATSEENLDSDGAGSYSYGSQFTFHGGLYGYPVAVVRRRLAAVPVIKGYTMTDVDFPLYFSSYDIPVVSASRHASFTRRHRLVRLHNRYTSMPAMRTERSISRTGTLVATGGSSGAQVAPPAEDEPKPLTANGP
ncbi:hypothetical protein FJT64_002407 [Amphibalanus amphitrite]|uniref:Uncharacterized protein n=1 Tax=Amphibalanus amphitrite TaxID=1232801 RepID=A0A6A4WSJ7_AMPAM|nr:hypothetical protein FJT64_002407 [Amphibalanus amphitrite]